MITAIFGGSFDPPHIGHLLVMASVLHLGRADEVLVVPCVAHPFGKITAAFEDRLAMVRLLLQGELDGRAAACDIEKRRGLSGRTLDTVTALRDELPGVALRLLVGADILAEKDRWHAFDRIERIAPLIVVGREGAPAPGRELPAVSTASSTDIRARIRDGRDCSTLVAPRILDYIAARGLYR
jgi:nicotinate-nucleotide adenylyltransferase